MIPPVRCIPACAHSIVRVFLRARPPSGTAHHPRGARSWSAARCRENSNPTLCSLLLWSSRLVGRARATSGPLRPIRRLAWGWVLERAGCLRGWGFSVRTGCVGGLDCVSCVSDGLCVCSFVSVVVCVVCLRCCVFHLLRFVCTTMSSRREIFCA